MLSDIFTIIVKYKCKTVKYRKSSKFQSRCGTFFDQFEVGQDPPRKQRYNVDVDSRIFKN